ncbi:MAG: hypothetical protein CMO10_16745 [Thalassospira sp.]|nr:hypothetical protein [Thalassospira sp.]
MIIARDTPDLARLMGAYLGRARLALLPDWNAATTLIKSLQTHNIGILAVLGFPDNPASIPLSAKHSRPDASPLRNDQQVVSQTSPHASGGLFHQNVVVPFKAVI